MSPPTVLEGELLVPTGQKCWSGWTVDVWSSTADIGLIAEIDIGPGLPEFLDCPDGCFCSASSSCLVVAVQVLDVICTAASTRSTAGTDSWVTLGAAHSSLFPSLVPFFPWASSPPD